MGLVDDFTDWAADKVQSFTGEKERRQLLASVKRQYNTYKKMVVENIESTNKLIVPFNQSIEILNDFRKNKFGNHIGILASFLGKFGRLKPAGQYTNERQQDLMVLPKRNFERKEEYISDADWTEDEVFEDTFFNTIFGQRSKTRKMNLSLHQNINDLKLETEAVKKQFEIKRYAMQNNTQIIAIYLSCLKTISEAIDNIIIPELDVVEAFFQATKLKNEVIAGNQLVNIQFPINMMMIKDTRYHNHFMFVKNAFMFYIIASKVYATPYLTRLLDDTTTEDDVIFLQTQQKALIGQEKEMNKYLMFEREVKLNEQ